MRHDRSIPHRGRSTETQPQTSIRDGSISHKPFSRLQRSSALTTEFVRHDLAKNPTGASEPDRVRVIREGVASYLPDIDPEETGEWLESFDELLERSGAGARPLPDAAATGAGRRTAGRASVADIDRLRQHHPHRDGAVVPRRRGRRTSLPSLDQVERRHHGAPRPASGSRCGRPYFDLCLIGGALRSRLQPFLPRQIASRRRRPGVHPGPCLPRHLRPGVPGGPVDQPTNWTASVRSTATPAAACRPTRTRG